MKEDTLSNPSHTLLYKSSGKASNKNMNILLYIGCPNQLFEYVWHSA